MTAQPSRANTAHSKVYECVLLIDFTEQICDTRNTTDAKCCVFPFTYRGELYYDCTTKDFGKEWCSLHEDYETHKQWGFCGKLRYMLC